MKKFLIIIISLFCLIGCQSNNKYAAVTLETYLNKYKNLDKDVLESIDSDVANQDLTDSQKDKYKDILKRQYQDMEYNILQENYNGNEALIKVELNVYNLGEVNRNVDLYMKENISYFLDEKWNFDNNKFIDYKLDAMLVQHNKVKYEIEFILHFDNGLWIVMQPSDDVLKKIHGLDLTET